MSLSKIMSTRSQVGQLLPNCKPRKAAVTEIGLIMYTPWWNGPVKVLRCLAAVLVLVFMAVLVAYLWLASWLIRLLLGVRPTVQLAWPSETDDAEPDAPEPERTLTGARRNSAKGEKRVHKVAGRTVIGTSVSMDDLAEEPF